MFLTGEAQSGANKTSFCNTVSFKPKPIIINSSPDYYHMKIAHIAIQPDSPSATLRTYNDKIFNWSHRVSFIITGCLQWRGTHFLFHFCLEDERLHWLSHSFYLSLSSQHLCAVWKTPVMPLRIQAVGFRLDVHVLLQQDKLLVSSILLVHRLKRYHSASIFIRKPFDPQQQPLKYVNVMHVSLLPPISSSHCIFHANEKAYTHFQRLFKKRKIYIYKERERKREKRSKKERETEQMIRVTVYCKKSECSQCCPILQVTVGLALLQLIHKRCFSRLNA